MEWDIRVGWSRDDKRWNRSLVILQSLVVGVGIMLRLVRWRCTRAFNCPTVIFIERAIPLVHPWVTTERSQSRDDGGRLPSRCEILHIKKAVKGVPSLSTESIGKVKTPQGRSIAVSTY